MFVLADTSATLSKPLHRTSLPVLRFILNSLHFMWIQSHFNRSILISRVVLPFLFVFSTFNINAQSTTVKHALKWQNPSEIKISQYDIRKVIRFEGADYSGDITELPYLYVTSPLEKNSAVSKIEFARTEYAPLTSAELALLPKGITLNSSPEIIFSTVYEKKKPFLTYRILPFRYTASGFEKLISFELTISSNPHAYTSPVLKSITTSVLSAGNWYKIGVTGTGIYKISKQFLASMGMNTSFDPRNLRVYGNGGAMLPERNNVFYPDDLAENAIYFQGESDGVFDDQDFVLFHAKGPVNWSYDATKGVFRHSKNLYSDTAWYFINTDIGAGKRINSQAQSSLTATHVVDVFDDYGFIENDEENFLKSGRRWFGNRMESSSSFSFNMSFAGSTAGPHKLISNLVARNTIATSFGISVNGLSFNQSVNALGGVGYLDTYAKENESVFTINGNLASTNVTVTRQTSSSIGWIDYLIFNVKKSLNYSGSPLSFRAQDVTGVGNIAEFRISSASSALKVWEVTNAYDVKEQAYTTSGSQISFIQAADSLRNYVVFNPNSSFNSPIPMGGVNNQNLHGTAQVDMIIVSDPGFLSSAETLANHHRDADGMQVIVTTPQQIYNEFSSGAQDISAIRNFVRMFYLRASNESELPKYLLLMGDGSYDPRNRIANNQNRIPTYESTESLNPIGSYCSDDFFGFMDPTEGTNIQSVGAGLLDIGVGRFPVNSVEECNQVVNKIINYTSDRSCMNDWRNIVAFIADDEDNGDHVKQAEAVSALINQNYPVYNIDKIYLDAYQQESGAGGQRYPQVNIDIDNRINRGALMVNYAGHGGEQSLALERVITIDDINTLDGLNNLPLFMTATCEFSRFDNPEFTSAGEYVMLNPNGGGIALFTTVRLTFSSSNANLNRNIMDTVFATQNGQHLRLGDILRIGKNAPSTGSSFNNRSFALLGDPAMMLEFPNYRVTTTSINGHPTTTSTLDTLSALDLVTITGAVTDINGAVQTNFNGVVIPTVFDKAATYYTLGNDPSSPIIPYQLQKNVIFRGPATVTNGLFTFSFVVPQDIQFNFGTGKISYYARHQTTLDDAHGYDKGVIVGGFSDSPTTDDTGPEIQLFMNTERFVSGGMTDENPDLLAYVQDDIGINTVGTGIGHDITAILDGNSTNPFILNDYYEADQDNFRRGTIRYPFTDLEPGLHTLTLKVWDVANNSSTATIEFIVVKAEELALDHVLNYPNPFTTSTQFFYEYNQPGVPVDVNIQIYSVAGKLVKSIQSTQVSSGYRSEPIVWDGLDDFGDKIGRGVYVYRLKVKTPDGKSAEKIEKLVIL